MYHAFHGEVHKMQIQVQTQVQKQPHLRLNIPTDCRQHFNNRYEIKKKLPTQAQDANASQSHNDRLKKLDM